LDPAVEAFFRAAGFSVLQGYGLTETSPVIALNGFGPEGLGTVGPPLDGVDVRIDEDGQILTRGPHVMKGYYKDPDATAQSMRDGWLGTGERYGGPFHRQEGFFQSGGTGANPQCGD
jgi:long-chain acyl-CoA synthetase